LDHWGVQFAREVGHRSEGQSDFILDLIDLLQQKATEFNGEAHKDFKYPLKVTAKGEDVEVSNGYRTATAIASALPGVIFIRIASEFNPRTFEAMLNNTSDGFAPDGIPGDCSDPSGLAEWMIHEIFEP
jgi:hypothetical protein